MEKTLLALWECVRSLRSVQQFHRSLVLKLAEEIILELIIDLELQKFEDGAEIAAPDDWKEKI